MMASGKRKFFVDTRQLAIALRNEELTDLDLAQGFYYLECTEWELWDPNGAYADLFLKVFRYDSDLARRWRWGVLELVRTAHKKRRGLFRQRGDVRRLYALNFIIAPFLRDELEDPQFRGIEANNFYDALASLRYYFDVI